MKPLRRTWSRFLGLFTGSRRESELSDEIAAHIEMQTEDNRKLGMTPAEARRAALLRFGGVEATKESYRDQRGVPVLETLAKDMRFAFRSLRKSPDFAAAAILSLALGIGAATAIFSIADTVLLRSLPYPEPQRLVTVSLGGAIPAPAQILFQREGRSLERSALFTSYWFNLPSQSEPERIPGARVSASLFDLLGVKPELGRTFTPEEDVDGRDKVVVIGDALWKRRFGADPGILGRTVRLNDAPYTIIGVMPPGFRFPEGPEHHVSVGPFPPAEMWRPMALVEWEQTCMGCYNFAMLARLRRGVTPQQASTELSGILKRQVHGEDIEPVDVLSLHRAVTGKVRTPLVILLASVGLTLLIACVNVANLLLARGLRRGEEIAIRLSLGATRWRIVQQGLMEAFALACCAALLAFPFAWAGIRGLVALAPAGIPRIGDVSPDPRLFAFALLLALATSVVFGITPALLLARQAPGTAMKAGTRVIGGAPSRVRAALVVAECALSLVLLVGSALLVRSFAAISRVPIGFRPEHVLTMQLSLPEARYDDHARTAIIAQLAERCGVLPGVTGAAAVSTLPLTGEAEGWGVRIEGDTNRDHFVMARARAVTPGYFRTLGTRLIAGREFAASDNGTNRVAVVSATLARELWPGDPQPLGRRLQGRPPITVVGIAEDTHASGLDAEVRPYLYIPFSQWSSGGEFALAIRTAGNPATLARAVKAEVWKIDRDQPVTHVSLMQKLVDDSVATRRFPTVLMILFAGFSVVLAAIGIYGMLSYSVAQRTQEIGIRMALGAQRSAVVGKIVAHACSLAVVGALFGLAAAWRLTRLLGSLLFGVAATEVAIFAACAALLVAVAIVASVIPARRAAKLEPVRCLRYE